jgi:hypothetical protein
MIKFVTPELIKQCTLSASTVNALFPVDNIKDFRRTKVYRSTANSASVVIDMHETSEVDSIFVVGSSIDGLGFSTLTLQMNGTDSWGSPAFSVSVPTYAAFDVAHVSFALQSYRFARLVMTSSLGYCELSNVMLGKALSPGPVDLGWTFQDADNSRMQENRYGQRFHDLIPRRRRYGVNFSNIDKTQLDVLLDLFDLCGESMPFIMAFDCEGVYTERERLIAMVYAESTPQISNRFWNNFSTSLTLVEAM